MTDIWAVQCPKCGSPLEVTPSTTQARCSFCGAALQLSRGSSGHPLATVLDSIQADTELLALEAVRRHVEGNLVDLRQSLVALEAASRATTTGPGVAGCSVLSVIAAVLAGLGYLVSDAMGAAGEIGLVVGFTLACVIFSLVWRGVSTKMETQAQEAQERYEQEQGALREQIASEEARLREVVARMDHIGRQV